LINTGRRLKTFREQLIPTTPPEVKEQRRKEVAGQMEEMERQVSAVVDLFDRTMHNYGQH
jgi:hypothetical protein